VRERLFASALPLADPDQLCLAIGELLAQTMGGSSGVLLSIFFTAAGTEMKRTSSLRGAFKKGVAAVQDYGGARLGDRTMLDALVPAIDALEAGSLEGAAAAAQGGAEATASMTHARAGRSSYLNSANLMGVRDPGATAVALAFVAAAQFDPANDSRLPACISDAEPLRKCGTTR
jgi:dihydroxyacetone kinase